MYRKKRRSWTKHVDFMLLDVLCMQLAFVISYIIRFGTDNPYTDGDYRTLAIAFLFIDFFVEIVSDSFKNVLKRGYFDEFIATCRHVILVELIVTFYLFTTQTGSFYSRFSYYIMVPFYIVTDYAARVIWKKILQKTGFNSAKKSLLIIAPEKILRETLQIVSADRRGYAKVTAVSLDTDLKGKNICGIPIVADRDGIIEYSCGEWVDEVFIPPCAESEYPNELVRAFLEMGIAVHTGITKSGSFPAGCQQVEKIGVYTVITTSMNYAESSKLLVKRLMDIAGGLVGCLITLLITIIVGPMIYISSPGPIFFAQERIGRNGRKFKMYKFRSMYMDAEERKKELMAQNKISDGLMFKMDFDPRIIGNKILPDGTRKTGIGEFIRKTSLDEFPQFINILLGDMSLVGTRPPTVDEWELYEPHHRARMSFRPGLTGMWQVSGRSNITDFEEVVKLDTQYISEWSLRLDVKILWKTVWSVLKSDEKGYKLICLLSTANTLKLSKASVTSYLPYRKGVYFPSTAEKGKISVGAERQRRYRAMKRWRVDPTEENFWGMVVSYAGVGFKTYSGLPFSYEIKKGRNGEYTKELWIDRREKSKSLAWSSVLLALKNIKGEVVDRPKALGDIRGVTYIYGMFYRFGLIDVPDEVKEKMGHPKNRKK